MVLRKIIRSSSFKLKKRLNYAVVIENLTKSNFFRIGFILTAVSLFTGALGYIYQILIGRMLSSAEFGLFSAIFSLVAILSSPMGAITLVISKLISSLSARNDIYKLQQIGKKISLYIVFACILFVFIVYFFTDTILKHLNSNNVYLVWLFTGLVISSALSSLNAAFLQGLQKFKSYVGLGLLWASLRIVSAILLLEIFDLGVGGAIAGALSSQLFVWLLGFLIIFRNCYCQQLNLKRYDSKVSDESPTKFRDIFAIISATSAFVVMSQLDVILANIFFSPILASQYAAAAILGKAILYIPGGLVFALFPMVVNNDVNRISSRHLMKQAIAITCALCLPLCIIYFFFGVNIINFFYGEKYPLAGELLSYFGFAILPMALIMVLEHFLLAKGRILFTLVFVVLVPIEIGIIYCSHQSLYSLISAVFIVGFLAFLIGIIVLYRENNL